MCLIPVWSLQVVPASLSLQHIWQFRLCVVCLAHSYSPAAARPDVLGVHGRSDDHEHAVYMLQARAGLGFTITVCKIMRVPTQTPSQLARVSEIRADISLVYVLCRAVEEEWLMSNGLAVRVIPPRLQSSGIMPVFAGQRA